MKYVLLISFWTLYFFFHSLLADHRVKENVQGALNISPRVYRLLYSIIFSVGLLFILVYNALISKEMIFVANEVIRFVALLLAIIGVIVIRMAFRAYSLSAFLGLTREENNHLVRDGILKHIRHPLYAGTILIVVGLFLYSPTWATLTTLVCVVVYLAVGIALEEQKLVKIYGEEYREYRRDVPALIPHFWKRI